WDGVCRSGRWWTFICCAYELVHRDRTLRPDLVDRAVRGAADRHVSGRGRRPAERLARCAGTPAAADEGDRHDTGGRRRLVRCLAADHQPLRELPPRLVCSPERLMLLWTDGSPRSGRRRLVLRPAV